MLHQLGYTSITALTRKPDSFELLKELGVSECLLVEDFLATPVKALMKQRFAFAIDTTGGEITSAVLPHLWPRCWNYIRDNRFTLYFTGRSFIGH